MARLGKGFLCDKEKYNFHGDIKIEISMTHNFVFVPTMIGIEISILILSFIPFRRLWIRKRKIKVVILSIGFTNNYLIRAGFELAARLA